MTREEAIAYGKDYYRDLTTACCEIDKKHKEFVRMAIQALSQINDIKAIINNPMYIQEDVLRYQMICEVVKE